MLWRSRRSIFFFFQAEDGIRDLYVTGVQTCALPISTDLSGANAVDGKQHQNCVIADGDGAIAGRGVYDFLHNIPSRSGGKRLVLEHARCHDRSSNTDRAPTSHFSVSKE